MLRADHPHVPGRRGHKDVTTTTIYTHVLTTVPTVSVARSTSATSKESDFPVALGTILELGTAGGSSADIGIA